MKNKLLITTALVALVSAGNAYADALNIADGDNITIEADQWDETLQKTNNIYDSISMTGGSLTGTPDIDGSLTVAGDAEFSGGTVNLTGHYDDEDEDNEKYSDIRAYISVNKALVTQASAAIPIVPLYFAILYKVMKVQGTHEGCIEQISRLFHEKLFVEKPITDEQGRIRMDDWELSDEVQDKVMECWKNVTTENVAELSDIDGYWQDFYQMFGFHLDGVDYAKDVDLEVAIPSLEK